jgi:peptide/nickel transport system ATP-binding protein
MTLGNSSEQEPVLRVEGLEKSYPIGGGAFAAERGVVRAVDGVSFAIQPGKTLGLVGESGCGKSTVARLVVRILEATKGEIWFRDGERGWVDLNKLSQRSIRPLRKNMQMIFQDPNASLNPRMTVARIVGEPLRSSGLAKGSELNDRVAETLRLVGLRAEYMNRYPHAFSGGQRQRIGLARAIISNPQLVVADEAVSALDVSVQAQVLNLFRDLQDQLGLAYLFISHDLGVVRHVSDRVAVMYLGRIVEMGSKTDLFDTPKHPYTEALLSAIPRPDPTVLRRQGVARGEIGDASRRPTGCAFHPRCRYAIDACKMELPPLQEIAPGHFAACHRAADLSLEGTASTSTSPPHAAQVVSRDDHVT